MLRPRATVRVVAAFRPSADAPFGPALTLGSGGALASPPSVAVDAAGRATVAWVSRGQLGGPSLVDIASTTLGGGFGPTQELASAAGGQIALTVAPSGRTLVVNYGVDAIFAYERAAGASAFAPIPVPASRAGGPVAVALADDGSAVIAYTTDFGLSGAPSAFVLLRRSGGAFGREQALEGSTTGDSSSSFGFGSDLGDVTSPPPDDAGAAIAAALDASGVVVVTWVDPGDRNGAASAHVARGTIAGGMTRGTRLGSPCRTANAARPLTLADGALGAVWTDNAAVTSQDDGDGDTPRAGGLLHVVVPGQAPPPAAGAPPGLSADLIGSVALRGGQPLRLRVRCRRGPCVVRATATAYPLDSSEDDASLVDGSIEVPHGHAAVLSLAPGSGNTFARLHDASARVSLLACTTTGARVVRSALHLRLRRLPPFPVPRVLQVVAHRQGRSVRVTWRTSIPARGVSFDVVALPLDLTHLVYDDVPGRGRSRFAITLRVPARVHPRSVAVQVVTGDQEDAGSVTARIR